MRGCCGSGGLSLFSLSFIFCPHPYPATLFITYLIYFFLSYIHRAHPQFPSASSSFTVSYFRAKATGQDLGPSKTHIPSSSAIQEIRAGVSSILHLQCEYKVSFFIKIIIIVIRENQNVYHTFIIYFWLDSELRVSKKGNKINFLLSKHFPWEYKSVCGNPLKLDWC